MNFKQLLDFDYTGFAHWLARERTIINCFYYVGLVRKEASNPKSIELMKNQQRLFAHLNKNGWIVKTGFMMKRGQDYKEKGVDVKLAVDVLDLAYQDKYDTAVIIIRYRSYPKYRARQTIGKENRIYRVFALSQFRDAAIC